MANTYTQVYIQLVFAVKHRACLLHKSWRQELFMYMAGIIKNQGHFLLAINGVEDHVHILISMCPHHSLSDLVRFVKSCSSRWINQEKHLSHPFYWQNGFGAFSYSPDAVSNVKAYIHNQEAHHSKTNFDTEYRDFLKSYDVDFKDEYFFKLED